MDVLLTVLAVALAFVVIATLVAVVAALVGMRSLKRRNRVSPDHPTEAPLAWMYSPVLAARLHRRLRSAVSVARMIRARHAADRLAPPHLVLAAELEEQAVALDGHLALIGRVAPAERKRLARHLAAEVGRVEQAASRLSLIDADAGAAAHLPHQSGAMQDLSDRLDQLEAARREVAEAEAHAGLLSPSPLPPRAPATDPRRRRSRG